MLIIVIRNVGSNEYSDKHNEEHSSEKKMQELLRIAQGNWYFAEEERKQKQRWALGLL